MTSATQNLAPRRGWRGPPSRWPVGRRSGFRTRMLFALVGVVLAVAALANGSSPQTVVDAFGDGFWDLTAFTLQMAMVVLTGYVVATCPVAKLIDRLATMPQTARSAVSFVAFLSMSVSFLELGAQPGLRWSAGPGDRTSDRSPGGLSRARRSGLHGAGRRVGPGDVLGRTAAGNRRLAASGAAENHRGSRLRHHDLHVAVPAYVRHHHRADRGDRPFLRTEGRGHRDRRGSDVDLDDQNEDVPPRSRPGEWLEYSRILPVLAGLMTLGWLISQLLTKPVLSVVSSLNGYLLVFLILGLVLHGTPRKFCDRRKAVPATGGILVQFPLYAAMAAILTKAEGRGGRAVSDQLAEFFTRIGSGGGFAVVIALYTVVLGLFVPSGGGKWLVEAPYVMQSATDVQMNLGWTVQIYNVAEAAEPDQSLAVLPAGWGSGARSGRIAFQFISTCRWSCWLLGMTFDFVPPVAPPAP